MKLMLNFKFCYFFLILLAKRTVCLTSLAFISFNAIASAGELGEISPPCALSSLTSEQKTDLKQYAGQVVYLDFWASWCPPCAKSFSFLNKLHRDLQADGLVVIGVNMDEHLADATEFLQRYPAEFQLASDQTKQCATDLNVRAMPSSYLIDRNGVIRYVHLGFRSGDSEQLLDQVQQLLAEPAMTDEAQ